MKRYGKEPAKNKTVKTQSHGAPLSVSQNVKQRGSVRLQVYLSHNGVCSRRQAMPLIMEGRVSVNGQVVTEPSFQVRQDSDQIQVNGKPVLQKAYQYVLLNKPSGYVTTTAVHHNEQNVMDLLPHNLRHLNPVGRLDKDTEGLLFLTNDGDLAFQLSHPKFDVDKVYFVKIDTILTPFEKSKLEKGIILEGQKTHPARIENLKTVSGRSQFNMTIHEGRKRQIRMMLEAIRHKVFYLQRIRQGHLSLSGLKTGAWRFLNSTEIEMLKKRRK